MTHETTQTQRTIMAVVAVLGGLFMIIVEPYLMVATLNPCLHALAEYYVPQKGHTWESPIPILSVTFSVWMAASVFAGVLLLIIAYNIYKGDRWARPVALGAFAIPSIGGMTMTIPWVVLVLGGGGIANTGSGPAPSMPIMFVGLACYFLILLLEKADWKLRVSNIVVFTALGVVAGMVFMNAQHGGRFFMARESAPFFEPNESVPELILGGYVNYASVTLFVLSIPLLAMRKRLGWYMAMVAALTTAAVSLISYIDRASSEWMQGAILSLGMAAVLVIPFFKSRLHPVEELLAAEPTE